MSVTVNSGTECTVVFCAHFKCLITFSRSAVVCEFAAVVGEKGSLEVSKCI